MQRSEVSIGQEVIFGRRYGEQTRGIVKKINTKTVQVEQIEQRGVFKSHAIGKVWKVPFSLMRPAWSPNGSPCS